jgi:phosphoribosylanthranilate isomerase
VQVKICGITTPRDAVHAARCGADFIGLIRAASPRQVSVAQIRQIRAALPGACTPVVLYQDAPLGEMLDELGATACTWVQLHGQESAALLRNLRAAITGIHIIKAWPIQGDDPLPAISAYLDAAQRLDAVPDVLLLDVPKGGPHPGLAALVEIAARLPHPPACFVAGGLTPENLHDLRSASGSEVGRGGAGAFDGVDVARGVEAAPGVKDPRAVDRFVQRAKSLM